MSCVYVTEQGAKVTTADGKLIIECGESLTRLIPIETIESLVLFGNVHVNISAQKELLERGISTSMLSTHGHYFGRLVNTSTINADRLKKQVYLSDNEEQCLTFAKRIIEAKIHNQVVVAKRYTQNTKEKGIAEQIIQISLMEKKVNSAKSIGEIMGIEGIAARYYFAILSSVVDKAFAFEGRNKRPPKDPFNAMLSLGYTIAFYEIYAELENQSISPYIGFIHSVQPRHPALVSDLLEEWRAVLVDATVMSLVQGHEIEISEFTKDDQSGAVIMSKKAVRKLVSKLESKMASRMNYLSYLDTPVSFRRGIWWQAKTLAHCIDYDKLSDYKPLRIR